jgi:ABC-type phosphate transport system substrate-binding protein
VSNAEALRSIVDTLGSNPGITTMAVVAVVGIGSPFLDRWVLRRKRIQYQVLYNSKIGLDTVFREHDEDEEPSLAPTNPLGRLAHELEHLSVMIIRIRNVGSSDIEESDIQPPLSVAFGKRIIWNARVSEASTDELRTHIRENLEFFTHDGWLTRGEVNALLDKTDTGYDYRNLSVVRRWLVQRLARTLTQTPNETTSAEPEPQWHGVRLAKLWLRRRQSFILMVVLREADDNSDEISKDYQVGGGRANRKTSIHKRRQGWFRWPIVTTWIGVILVGALLGTVLAKAIIGAQPDLAGLGVPCVTGSANLAGSSAFGPIVQTIGDDYMAACPGSHIVVNTTGSIDGVRSLIDQGPQSAGDQAALSDGPRGEAPNDMGRQQLVVLVYTLLINKSVGVDHLGIDQVLGIYNGRYTNWSQLGGASLPIRIVGREGGSGTRRTLEQYVLKTTEGVLSSNNCLTKDRITSAPTILCELPTTGDVVTTVSMAPGAIGYADFANQDTKNAVADDRVVPVVLDGRYPQVGSLPGYPFWTVEYLYTWTPGVRSPIGAFVDYLKSDSAQTVLRNAGYTPCVVPGGSLNPLCTQR